MPSHYKIVFTSVRPERDFTGQVAVWIGEKGQPVLWDGRRSVDGALKLTG